MATEITSLKNDWTKLAELYATGASDVEVAHEMKITEGKFLELYEALESFRNFVDLGRTSAKAWWYRTGRTGLFMEKFGGSLYNFQMKNRYGWADKQEVNDTTDKSPVDMTEAANRVKKAIAAIEKKDPVLYRKLVDGSE